MRPVLDRIIRAKERAKEERQSHQGRMPPLRDLQAVWVAMQRTGLYALTSICHHVRKRLLEAPALKGDTFASKVDVSSRMHSRTHISPRCLHQMSD